MIMDIQNIAIDKIIHIGIMPGTIARLSNR